MNSISSNHMFNTFSITNLGVSPCVIEFKDKLSIVLIDKGIGQIFINGHILSISTPTIICLNETERIDIQKSCNITGRIISFSPSVVKSHFNFKNVRELDHNFTTEDIRCTMLLSMFFNRYTNYTGYITTSKSIISQLNEIVDTMTPVPSQPEVLSSKVCELLSTVSRLITTYSVLSETLVADTSFEVKDIIIYLHNHYKHKITIPDLSKIFHVNRTTLSDRFYEATGETIITYLNRHRINISAILLRESQLTISEISEQVGFNDTAYFAKLFKKYMHHTPSGYRQRYYSFILNKPKD